MPGFFDFTDFTQPMSPTAPSLDDQGWGGDLMQPQQPIVPENYDIFGSGMPQMPQMQQQGGAVPYDALGAMAGIQMPEIPQQDDMGRYGITEGQQRGAGYQSLAEILRGAGATLFNDRPDDVMAAAARSGDIRRGALDKASLENVNAFKLKADVEAKKLDMISRMSDIQRQQLQIEAEKMKLDDLKMQRAVAVEFGKEMAPVAEDFLKRAATMYPDKVPAMRAQFLVAKEKLASGDLAGADIAFNAAKQEFPPEWQREMEERMLKKSFEAAANFGLGMDYANTPEAKAKATSLGGVIEADANGNPSFVSAHELQKRKLEIDRINASIRASDANAAYYSNGGPGGAGRGRVMTPNEISTKRVELSERAGRMLQPRPDITDANKIAQWEQQRAEDDAVFKSYGINAQDWLSIKDPARMNAIITGDQAPAYGMPAPQVGVVSFAGGASQGGGKKIPTVARAELVNVANKGPLEKRMAVMNLVNSGDPEAKALAAQAMKEMGGREPKNDAEAEEMSNRLYNYVVTHLSNL